jgi:hypothetical protein
MSTVRNRTGQELIRIVVADDDDDDDDRLGRIFENKFAFTLTA